MCERIFTLVFIFTKGQCGDHTGKILFLTLAFDPMLSHQAIVAGANSGNGSCVAESISVLRVSRTLRNFRLSPISIALATHGKYFLMLSSIGMGAMFSPPAVIKISFALPAKSRKY